MKVGHVIAGQYELVSLAGEGAMGSVWRGQTLDRSEQVAIKTLKLDLSATEVLQQRFLREATALAALEHPHIVRYLGHGLTETHELYMVMEWLEGCHLASVVRQGQMPIDEALSVARQMADALDVVHRNGLLHRDVKPDNIFLQGGSTDNAKLTDFGVAKIEDDAGHRLTATGAIVGTGSFMSPEQAMGDKTIDARADLFSLGAVMYSCVAGVVPYRGDNLMQVLRALMMEDAPRVRLARPDVPPGLDELIARMLSRERDQRPTSAAEVLALVDELISEA